MQSAWSRSPRYRHPMEVAGRSRGCAGTLARRARPRHDGPRTRYQSPAKMLESRGFGINVAISRMVSISLAKWRTILLPSARKKRAILSPNCWAPCSWPWKLIRRMAPRAYALARHNGHGDGHISWSSAVNKSSTASHEPPDTVCGCPANGQLKSASHPLCPVVMENQSFQRASDLWMCNDPAYSTRLGRFL
jgi:hypothetical protein